MPRRNLCFPAHSKAAGPGDVAAAASGICRPGARVLNCTPYIVRCRSAVASARPMQRRPALIMPLLHMLAPAVLTLIHQKVCWSLETVPVSNGLPKANLQPWLVTLIAPAMPVSRRLAAASGTPSASPPPYLVVVAPLATLPPPRLYHTYPRRRIPLAVISDTQTIQPQSPFPVSREECRLTSAHGTAQLSQSQLLRSHYPGCSRLCLSPDRTSLP